MNINDFEVGQNVFFAKRNKIKENSFVYEIQEAEVVEIKENDFLSTILDVKDKKSVYILYSDGKKERLYQEIDPITDFNDLRIYSLNGSKPFSSIEKAEEYLRQCWEYEKKLLEELLKLIRSDLVDLSTNNSIFLDNMDKEIAVSFGDAAILLLRQEEGDYQEQQVAIEFSYLIDEYDVFNASFSVLINPYDRTNMDFIVSGEGYIYQDEEDCTRHKIQTYQDGTHSGTEVFFLNENLEAIAYPYSGQEGYLRLLKYVPYKKGLSLEDFKEEVIRFVSENEYMIDNTRLYYEQINNHLGESFGFHLIDYSFF